MIFSSSDYPALLLIDIQQAFDDLAYWGGERNNLAAETNAAKVLYFFRQYRLPLFHIQHCSVNPLSPLSANNKGNAFKEMVLPLKGEVVIQKSVNSAFIGTDLQTLLNETTVNTVIIMGFTTDHCVSTTARMAANFGYKTLLVEDACVAFGKRGIYNEWYDADTIHLTALSHLKDEFATIVTTDQLLGALQNKYAVTQPV